jgi:hypothetical protein
MKIIKKKLLFISILFFILSLHESNISLAKLWILIHVNSLIGLQKLIESLNLSIDIWQIIVTNLLELKVFFILAIIMFFLFVYKNIYT